MKKKSETCQRKMQSFLILNRLQDMIPDIIIHYLPRHKIEFFPQSLAFHKIEYSKDCIINKKRCSIKQIKKQWDILK